MCLWFNLSFSMNLTLVFFAISRLKWFHENNKTIYFTELLWHCRFSYTVAIPKRFHPIRTVLRKELFIQTCGPLIPGIGNGTRSVISMLFLFFQRIYRCVLKWKGKHCFVMIIDTIMKESLALHHLVYENQKMIFVIFWQNHLLYVNHIDCFIEHWERIMSAMGL